MKPDLTLSEQMERETLASRVYAATVSWELAAKLADEAIKRSDEAWSEREAALAAQADFRRRMAARPEATCEGCGAPAVVIWSGEGYCADCDAMLEIEQRQLEDEQLADYARTRGV